MSMCRSSEEPGRSPRAELGGVGLSVCAHSMSRVRTRIYASKIYSFVRHGLLAVTTCDLPCNSTTVRVLGRRLVVKCLRVTTSGGL